MTQPGVYFTLDAPFVSIIGLYSNVLDAGPGVISSQGGHFPIVDDQLGFLTSELTRLKPQRAANQRAVIIAVHHPPLSADAKHGGSLGIMKDIDACCNKAGLFPDALLCGHAHLYQRFTRVMKGGKEVPYIVAGSGGFAATVPKQIPKVPLRLCKEASESIVTQRPKNLGRGIPRSESAEIESRHDCSRASSRSSQAMERNGACSE
jgi:hypothetical protein